MLRLEVRSLTPPCFPPVRPAAPLRKPPALAPAGPSLAEWLPARRLLAWRPLGLRLHLLLALAILWLLGMAALACVGDGRTAAGDGGLADHAGPAVDAALADAPATERGPAGDGDARPPDRGPVGESAPAIDRRLADSRPHPDAHSWGPCTAQGIAGQCIDVADCGPGHIATPHLCPGPANIQCCTPIGGACDPTAHPQPNLGLVEAGGQGGCLGGMVPVADFCIDRYEASLWLIHDDGSTEPWSPYWNPESRRVRAVSIAGAVPQGYLAGAQAEAACAEAGKRLCSDGEWQRACRGPDSATYPYGNTRQPGVCNDARASHPVIDIYGPGASFSHDEMSNACLNQLPDTVDPAGANSGCVTAEGVFDMMGNLHEWTANPAGTFRGGFYCDTLQNGNGCLYATTAHTIGYWDYSTGFRCCADLPPQ